MNSDCLSLLTQIATWITVLLVFLTLIEMTKQRKATYKPDIVISNHTIYAYISKLGFPDIWLDKRIDEENGLETFEDQLSFQIPIHNLGLGPARDIEFRWEYDSNTFIKMVDQLKSYSPVEFNLLITEPNMLHFEIPDIYQSYINLEAELVSNKLFVLPYSMESVSDKISLPPSYMRLVSIYSLCEIFRSLSNQSRFPHLQIPQIELFVKYNDIGGSSYSKTFKFNLLLGEVRFYKQSGDKLEFKDYSMGNFVFFAYLNKVH